MKKQLLAVGTAALMTLAGIGNAVAADGVHVDINSPADGSTVAEGDKLAGTVGAGSTGEEWNVVFVVDNSGSTYSDVNGKSVFEWEQAGGRALLNSLQNQSNDVNMGVVYFGSGAAGFGLSKDMQDVEKWLSFDSWGDEIYSTGGSTSCELGMQEANKLLDGVNGNKRIYFLTDGMCNGWQDDLDAEVAKAKKNGIDVRAIHTTESSEQCKADALQASSCTYSEDPSKLAAQLPKELAGEVKSLELVITDADGKAVATEDMTGILDGSLQQDWEYALPALEDGTYTIEATATGEDGAATTDTLTITVGKPVAKPEPTETAKPEPTETAKPEPTETKAPEKDEKKPGRPKTGF